jgi:hypothetical protein
MLRFVVLSIVALGFVACSKEEPKTEEKSSEEKADKKKSDEDEPKSKKKKKTDDDEEKKDDESSSEGSRDSKGSIVPEGTPVPPGCGPDPSGLLGAKPKLVASAGQPGASLAIWQRADDNKKQAAITVSADGKCYVDYLEMKEGPGNVAQLLGYSFDKGAIQAVTGTTEKGGATIVGFKVTYTEGVAMGHRMLDTYARFYGYVHANGTPYSCNKITGEKGDRCAMYQKPLVVQTSSTCKDEKGGGPTAPSAPSVLKIPTGLKLPGAVPPVPSASAAPSVAAPIPSAAVVADAGAPDSGVKCDGTPSCSTVAALSKDKDHVYVRTSAGKPTACSTGTVKIGDTWYFDESTWKKR